VGIGLNLTCFRPKVITTTEAIFDLRRTVWFYGAGQQGLVLDIAMMQPLWAIALSVDVSLK